MNELGVEYTFVHKVIDLWNDVFGILNGANIEERDLTSKEREYIDSCKIIATNTLEQLTKISKDPKVLEKANISKDSEVLRKVAFLEKALDVDWNDSLKMQIVIGDYHGEFKQNKRIYKR